MQLCVVDGVYSGSWCLLLMAIVQLSDSFKRERSWAEEDRRETRVGSWRTFQKDGKRRKEMDAHGWKEETRVCVAHSCGLVSWLILTI